MSRRATRVANHDVHAMAKREPGLRGMGTTVSAAGIVGDRLVVATVGDSRVYVLRGQEIVQVDPMHAGPAEMIGNPFRVDARGKFLQRGEIIEIERCG